jgi:DNA mismatch repair protein MutH
MNSTGAPPRSEAELLERARHIAGRTLREVAAGLDLPVPANLRRHKGWIGTLIERSLGADAASHSRPDFTALDIELKTVPIGANGQPRESTFVCVAALGPAAARWQDSAVRRKLARVLWVPVEAAAALPLPQRRIGSALLWSPDAAQERLLRDDYEELAELIAVGRLHQISARQGRVLQVRPKAANARSLTASFNEDGEPSQTMPRGFYLRARFTAAVLTGAGKAVESEKLKVES